MLWFSFWSSSLDLKPGRSSSFLLSSGSSFSNLSQDHVISILAQPQNYFLRNIPFSIKGITLFALGSEATYISVTPKIPNNYHNWVIYCSNMPKLSFPSPEIIPQYYFFISVHSGFLWRKCHLSNLVCSQTGWAFFYVQIIASCQNSTLFAKPIFLSDFSKFLSK